MGIRKALVRIRPKHDLVDVGTKPCFATINLLFGFWVLLVCGLGGLGFWGFRVKRDSPVS